MSKTAPMTAPPLTPLQKQRRARTLQIYGTTAVGVFLLVTYYLLSQDPPQAVDIRPCDWGTVTGLEDCVVRTFPIGSPIAPLEGVLIANNFRRYDVPNEPRAIRFRKEYDAIMGDRITITVYLDETQSIVQLQVQ